MCSRFTVIHLSLVCWQLSSTFTSKLCDSSQHCNSSNSVRDDRGFDYWGCAVGLDPNLLGVPTDFVYPLLLLAATQTHCSIHWNSFKNISLTIEDVLLVVWRCAMHTSQFKTPPLKKLISPVTGLENAVFQTESSSQVTKLILIHSNIWLENLTSCGVMYLKASLEFAAIVQCFRDYALHNM